MIRDEKIGVKVCGMRDRDNIRMVASFLPDYMGFIFYPESPRFVGNDFTVPEDLPHSIRKVGVFVNESSDNILVKARHAGLDAIQLHGNESAEECNALRSAGFTVIKVFSIGEHFDFSVTKSYAPSVDFFLFDTKGRYYGGNANTFDWDILKRYDQEVPFFLSGGISPENVECVKPLRDMNLYALDVNSGVEDMPGVKSPDKLKSLFSRLPSR
jgi:phosphoribosylanthranilate isomerase